MEESKPNRVLRRASLSGAFGSLRKMAEESNNGVQSPTDHSDSDLSEHRGSDSLNTKRSQRRSSLNFLMPSRSKQNMSISPAGCHQDASSSCQQNAAWRSTTDSNDASEDYGYGQTRTNNQETVPNPRRQDRRSSLSNFMHGMSDRTLLPKSKAKQEALARLNHRSRSTTKTETSLSRDQLNKTRSACQLGHPLYAEQGREKPNSPHVESMLAVLKGGDISGYGSCTFLGSTQRSSVGSTQRSSVRSTQSRREPLAHASDISSLRNDMADPSPTPADQSRPRPPLNRVSSEIFGDKFSYKDQLMMDQIRMISDSGSSGAIELHKA